MATHPRYLDPRVLQKLNASPLAARQTVEGLRVGSHRSLLRGFSTEFSYHRPYAPGDAIRHLDWRVYGRSERYYTKLYEAETNFDAHLLLDASSSMRYGSQGVSKLDYAKSLAVTLAYLIREQHDSSGLAVFDSAVRVYLPPAGTRSMVNIIDTALQAVQPQPKTDLGALLEDIAHRLRRRGVVLLISDLLDDTDRFARGLDQLRHRKQDVIVFHVLDHNEIEFQFDGTVRFVGLENEPEIMTQPKRIRDAYRAEAQQFIAGCRTACLRRGVQYAFVDTSRPLDAFLNEFLTLRATSHV